MTWTGEVDGLGSVLGAIAMWRACGKLKCEITPVVVEREWGCDTRRPFMGRGVSTIHCDLSYHKSDIPSEHSGAS